jgi:hypothetical protein
MVQSDALSRQEDFDTGDTDNEDMTMLPESLFINSIDIKLHDLLAESIMKDNLIINALKAIKHGGTPPMNRQSLTGESTMVSYFSETDAMSCKMLNCEKK